MSCAVGVSSQSDGAFLVGGRPVACGEGILSLGAGIVSHGSRPFSGGEAVCAQSRCLILQCLGTGPQSCCVRCHSVAPSADGGGGLSFHFGVGTHRNLWCASESFDIVADEYALAAIGGSWSNISFVVLGVFADNNAAVGGFGIGSDGDAAAGVLVKNLGVTADGNACAYIAAIAVADGGTGADGNGVIFIRTARSFNFRPVAYGQ